MPIQFLLALEETVHEKAIQSGMRHILAGRLMSQNICSFKVHKFKNRFYKSFNVLYKKASSGNN